MTRMLLLLVFLASSATLRADDWPNWMGKDRDNVWKETGILETFPAGGPKILWRTKLAGGYAGPAVSGGRVYVMDYDSKDLTQEQLDSGNFDRKGSSGTESLHCFEEKTGKKIWSYPYAVKYSISYPSGPRCTPLVENGKVYMLGAEGHLACLDIQTGKPIWKKELKDEYKTKSDLWGYAAHPMIDGQKLITLAGGDGTHVIALDKDTGKEIWHSQTQSSQGYSVPLLTEVAGKRQMIVFGPQALRALDPETGKRIWTTPFSSTGGSTIMTPVRHGDYIFVGGYEAKNLLVKLKADGSNVDVVWKDKRNAGMSPVSVQPFLQDGVLYGYDDNGKLYAVELPSGKRLWEGGGPLGDEPPGSATAFIVKNGDRFIFFAETGHLVFGKLTPKGYEEISRAKVIDQTNVAFGRKVVWCMPAYANKHCYVRNDKELICVDLAK
ncbi:MAG: PQQ-binding-like beta-propeller repeat protein [Gemmataceae bacterium]